MANDRLTPPALPGISRRSLLSAMAALGGLAPPASQAQDFPTRPIKWIVPYLAGTAPDNTVRVVGDAMAEILKQPVVVDNKGGAAGNLGAQIAARAPADGYTWVYSATTMATSMRMYKKPGYDVMRDFTHIGRIASSDLILVVNPGSGIRTLKDLLERARKHPGQLSYASGGVGTPAHMGAEMLLAAAGAEALHVPFKGASESANAVMGRQVDFALTIFSVSQQLVNTGKLTALAVMGPQRNARLPDVPTAAETGLPVASQVSFGGLSVPVGTPAPVAQRIAQALNQALTRPDVRAKLEALGGTVSPSTGEQLSKDLAAEIALTERMMKAAKLEPQ